MRVFAFENHAWPKKVSPNQFTDCTPRIELLKLSARYNPRVLPQQSVNLFSNVVDIESCIEQWEIGQGRRVLLRIDIPRSERQLAMKELRVMGISSASLFPGLDGICKSFSDIQF